MNTVQVEGLEGLISTFKHLSDMSSHGFARVARRAAQPAYQAARAQVPVRTGALRRTIRVVQRPYGVAIRAGGSKVPYAKAIHFGWPKHHISPNPFLFRALDSTADQVASNYLQELMALWEAGIDGRA